MKKLLAILLLLSACITTPGAPPVPSHPEPSDLLAAQALVWTFYGHTGPNDPPPRVEVISGAGLTCRNSPCPTQPCKWLGFGAIGVAHGACNAGIEGATDMVTIARVDMQPWHETALDHEDLHADEGAHGVIDLGHMGKDWQPGGRLDQATQLMIKNGY